MNQKKKDKSENTGTWATHTLFKRKATYENMTFLIYKVENYPDKALCRTMKQNQTMKGNEKKRLSWKLIDKMRTEVLEMKSSQ